MRTPLPRQRRTICCAAVGGFAAAWLAVFPAVAQSPSPSAEGNAIRARTVRHLKSNQSSKRSIGSAGRLSGKIAIGHIFCLDDHSLWSQQDQDRVLSLMQQALVFIKNESRRHDQQVEFAQRNIGSVRLHQIISTDAMADPTWTEEAIGRASGKSAAQLVVGLRDELSVRNVLICLHVNKSALSYNLAYYHNVNANFHAERMVCFAKYPDHRETAAATYAHEVLHLFGAGDLYFPYDVTPARKLRAAKLFPDDVMYRVDYNLENLQVGPFTAFRVGWTDQLDPPLRIFEDN